MSTIKTDIGSDVDGTELSKEQILVVKLTDRTGTCFVVYKPPTLFPPVSLDCHDQKKPLIIASLINLAVTEKQGGQKPTTGFFKESTSC